MASSVFLHNTEMTQRSIFDVLAGDPQPIGVWLACLRRLVPAVYPYDADLSRTFEQSLRGLDWSAYALDCARTDDPTVPEENASATTFLAWYFAKDPQKKAELRRLITRIDQLLGRHALLDAIDHTDST